MGTCEFVYSGLTITVSHWPFSEQVQEMTSYMWHLSVKMAGRKCTSTSNSSIFDSSQTEKKDRPRLLLGPLKDGKGNTMLPTRV